MILGQCFVISLVLVASRATPWNAPDALTSLASASFPHPSSDPYTNIADLRRRQEKIRHFEEGKMEVGDTEHIDVDADVDKNDASPDDARKRLGVVLEKLKGIFNNRNVREDRDEVNEIDDVPEKLNEGVQTMEGDNNDSNNERFGQIGVFFVELLGSIVGLAYGAVAHFNNITAPPDV